MWTHRMPVWMALTLAVVALALGLWLGSALWYPPEGQVVSVCEVPEASP